MSRKQLCCCCSCCLQLVHPCRCPSGRYLVVSVDGRKALGVLRQLHADVGTAHKDAFQRLPLLLHVSPRRQHCVNSAEALLPSRHAVAKHGVELDVLLAGEALQLKVVVLQRLGDSVINLVAATR